MATRDLTPPQKSLATLMSDISEDLWCAGWLHDTEHVLWDAVQQGGECEWGLGSVSAETVAWLRRLSEIIGGWIIHRNGAEFMPMAEWLAYHEASEYAAWKRDEARSRALGEGREP